MYSKLHYKIKTLIVTSLNERGKVNYNIYFTIETIKFNDPWKFESSNPQSIHLHHSQKNS